MRIRISSVVLMLSLIVFPLQVLAKAETYAGSGPPGSENPVRPHYNKDYGEKNYGGSTEEVRFDRPQGGAVWDGQLYFADTGNHRIRRVRDNGFDQFNQIKTITDTPVGSGDPRNGTAQGFSGDGGPARYAQLNSPTAIAFDDVGNMYIADNGNNRIRKVAGGIGGVISTFAGNGSDVMPFPEEGDIWNGYGNLPTDTPLRNIVDLVWANGELYIASSSEGLFYVSTDGYLYQITTGSVRGLAVDPEERVYATFQNSSKGNGLVRIFPNKSMVLVHGPWSNNQYTNQIGSLNTANIHMGKFDFDAFGALFVVGLNSPYDEVYKVYNGNTIRNSFGMGSEFEPWWTMYPTDIIFDRKNNRYFVINTLHEIIQVVSNLNEGGMDPIDGGDDVDGSCGLDATTDGEVFSCNPVNLATGTKVDYVLDLGHNGPYPIQWGRYYHSKKGAWTFEYERSVKVWGGSSRSFMSMHRPDGVTLNFKKSGSGPWERNMDLNNTVVNVPTTIMNATVVVGYEYKNLKDEIERYNADGQLQYIQSKEGWRLTMQYDGFGRLIKVSDSFNHVLNLSYSIPNSNNVSFLTSASDGERTIQYTFVRGNNKNLLTKVTNPLGYFVQYQYDDSNNPNTNYKQGQGLLTEIISENDWPFARYTYDNMGRATSTIHYNGGQEVNRNEFYYYEEAGVTDFVQNGLYNTAFVGKKWYTNGASKPRNILSPCLTCIGSKYRRSNYDERGNPIEQFDFNNVKSTNTYDTTRNLLTSKIEAVGKPGEHMTAIEWHPTWREPTEIVEEKLINDEVVMVTTTNMYNTNGQLLSSTVANDTGDLPRTQTVSYNAQKLPHVITDAMGRATTLTYDQYGNVLTQTNNLGHTTTYSQYTTSGIPRLTTYPNGLQRKLTLDANQQVTKMEVGTNNSHWRTTTVEYDVRGLPQRKDYEDGRFEIYGYDTAKRLISINDGFGTKTYQYDEYSRVVKEILDINAYGGSKPESQVKEYNYDEFGRVMSQRLGLNGYTYFTYDNQGNVLKTNAPDVMKDYVYDEFNQIVEEKFSPGFAQTGSVSTTTRTYYTNGMLKSATDERGITTVYKYNGFGEVIRIESPDAGVQLLNRNKNGEVISFTDGRSVLTEFVRDGLGRVVQKNITTPTATTGLILENQHQTYVYDTCPNGVGLLCSIQNYAGTQTYSYNFWGDVMEKVVHPAGVSFNLTVKYTYGEQGLMEKVEYPSGRYALIYNQFGIPSNIYMYNIYTETYPNGNSVEYSYWYHVLIQGQRLPLGETLNNFASEVGSTRYEYDAAGDVKSIQTPTSPLNGYSPGFNGITTVPRQMSRDYPKTKIYVSTVTNNRVLINTDHTHDFKGYLRNSRLFAYHAPPMGMGYSTVLNYEYQYDAAGNRTLQKMDETPEGVVNYTYSSTSNRLSSISQNNVGVQTFSYDNAGNTIAGNNWTYLYDGENRLRSATNSNTTYFEYNSLGQRIKKDGANGQEYFLYDEQDRVLGVYDENGHSKEELVWGTGWTPLATLRGFNTANQTYFIEVDHLDAPTYIRDHNKNIVWSWDNREGFGYIAPNEDEDGDGSYFEFNLRFPGQWFDKETGLFHNGFRDYNPSTGRYMQSDPLGLEAGFNTYSYVGSNPFRAVDPYGLKIVFAENAKSLGAFHLDILRSSSPTAKKYIDLLEGLPDVISVSCGESSGQKGLSVIWNPSLNFIDRGGNLLANGSLSLFHELYHVYQESTAFSRLDWNLSKLRAKIFWDQDKKSRWSNPLERDAIRMESHVWREMGNKNTRSSHNRNYIGNPYKIEEKNNLMFDR